MLVARYEWDGRLAKGGPLVSLVSVTLNKSLRDAPLGRLSFMHNRRFAPRITLGNPPPGVHAMPYGSSTRREHIELLITPMFTSSLLTLLS